MLSRRLLLPIALVSLVAATVAVAFASGANATTQDGSHPSPEDIQAVFAKLGFVPKATDRTYRIPSSSMESTLHCARPEVGCEAGTSDRIIVREYDKSLPKRGDIVAFLTPGLAKIRCGAGGTFVQRIVGMPGERIQVRLKFGNGWVYVNGKPLKEPYIQLSRRPSFQGIGPVRVPSDSYYLMADNRSQACDSRIFGAVRAANIIGKTVAIYWPAARAKRL